MLCVCGFDLYSRWVPLTLLNLGPRWPRKVFGRLIQQRKFPLRVRFWPLEKFCNLLRLSLKDYVSNGRRATRWLARSQWMAYVDSIGIICSSQWVVYADPIDIICSSQWVIWAVSFSFIQLYQFYFFCQWVASHFLWKNNKDKTKRECLYQDYGKGGILMLMLKALRLAWLPRLLNRAKQNWKSIPDHFF